MRGLVWLCAGLTCALLVFLIGYIFLPGHSGPDLGTAVRHRPVILTNTIGILPNILNTLYIILVAMVVVLPLGVGAAIYLTEYAASGWLVRIIEFAAETLTGIPSIIFGLVGMLLFVQKLGLQAGMLAGGLTLVMMILPTIIRTTQESLKTVPQSYREGALGAGRRQVAHGPHRGAARRGGRHRHRLYSGHRPHRGGVAPPCCITAGFGHGAERLLRLALHTSSATLTVALYVYATERRRDRRWPSPSPPF